MAFISVVLLLITVVSVLSSNRLPTVHAASCFAVRAHESHGSADTQKDADAHNKANQGPPQDHAINKS